VSRVRAPLKRERDGRGREEGVDPARLQAAEHLGHGELHGVGANDLEEARQDHVVRADPEAARGQIGGRVDLAAREEVRLTDVRPAEHAEALLDHAGLDLRGERITRGLHLLVAAEGAGQLEDQRGPVDLRETVGGHAARIEAPGAHLPDHLRLVTLHAARVEAQLERAVRAPSDLSVPRLEAPHDPRARRRERREGEGARGGGGVLSVRGGDVRTDEDDEGEGNERGEEAELRHVRTIRDRAAGREASVGA